jgi:WD40 repeat protein
MKRLLSFAVMLGLLIASHVEVRAQGQQPPGSVSSPILSFVVDGGGVLHPLNGIAGSASVGPSLSLSTTIHRAVVSPAHDYILADTDAGMLLLKAQGTEITAQPLNTVVGPATNNVADCYAIAALSVVGRKLTSCIQQSTSNLSQIDMMVLSSTGSAAALYSQPEARIFTLSGLAQQPSLVATIDTQSIGAISMLAVSDDGQSMIAATADGNSTSLFQLKSGQPAQVLGTVGQVSAIRFLVNSSDAVVADNAANTIYRISGGQLFTLASASDGISNPNSIAISNDNQRVFVASGDSGSVTTLHLSGGPAEATLCHCAVTGLYPTNTDSVFRVTEFSGGPVLLFDYSGPTPRMVFAPSVPQLQEQ